MNKENKKTDNQKIFGLVLVILVVMLVVYLTIEFMGNGLSNSENEKTITSIVKKNETAVIYVENSDKSKCKECNKMKKYLDKEKIDYILYDVKKYKNSEYKKMLQTLNINANDFNYPAVIYIKEGKMYSNIINLDNTEVIKQFIKDYELKK